MRVLASRRDRRLVALLAAAVAAWWAWPRPAPAPAAAVVVPEVEGDLACDVMDAPGAAEPAPSEAASVDSGGPIASLPPPTWVACPIPAELDRARPAGALYLDGDRGPQLETFRYLPGFVWVPWREGVYAGRLYLEGFSRFDLDLQGGRCEPGAVVAKATINGVVRHPGPGVVTVQGCGANATVDAYGGFFAEIDPSPCTFFAVRQDGDLLVRSAPLALSPQPGEELIVDLELPAWRAAGVGARLELRDGGVVVGAVDDEGPAARAGLAAGEEVVALDGLPVADLDLWALGDRLQGPEDTPLVVTVLRDGEPVELTLSRGP